MGAGGCGRARGLLNMGERIGCAAGPARGVVLRGGGVLAVLD